ncbi:hypothetical protein ThrDRAFT_04700 [Frankia casuarinae]|jgi:hypothetical protein|nr:hypothetical protein CcI6DRAFT_04789 [Frankia sp. CcI6]EYT89685.1 hypothetical protein ThrDRAFT_04700 [Frankia casuarinae]KDA40818.1 hypothetical protein BMG523Draft_04362 [Frankia sp. BMG5.23]KEZ37046.1 hypothetical protein CEDDRAFT_01573 [Frankia sp. CeD]KFB02533.1 hypothetical protein ALLO2DRAFT_04722 [Frankia sp. Allo2]
MTPTANLEPFGLRGPSTVPTAYTRPIHAVKMPEPFVRESYVFTT